MSIVTRLKGIMSVILHGEQKAVTANISYLSPSNTLIGKKIIITGGGRGLGFAMAKRFIEEGAEVLITGRNEDVLKESAKKLGCKYYVMDVTDLRSFTSFVKDADAILNGVNTLVNNAGISLHETSFFDVTPETFNKQLATNLEGPFFLTQAFIRLMIGKKRQATVLFVSSETGDTVDFRPYGFTKGAINSMVKGLAYLFRQDNIRINAVAPGVTASDMTGLSAEGNLSAGEYATGRYYLPEEIAEVAVFIISDASNCISGQIITCNNAQTVNARWK